MRNYYIVPHTPRGAKIFIGYENCRENEICDFKKHKATKKEVAENSELIYRKEYLQIKKL